MSQRYKETQDCGGRRRGRIRVGQPPCLGGKLNYDFVYDEFDLKNFSHTPTMVPGQALSISFPLIRFLTGCQQ
jgi:hypothetical protein